MALLKKAKRKNSFKNKFKEVFFSSQVFPIFLTFTVLGVLFVLFRMKGIEVQYKVGTVNKDIERVSVENKDLKARKARLLSIKRLRKMAQTHNLIEPKQKQIIVVP